MAFLVRVNGESTGEIIKLDRDQILIGRQVWICNIVIHSDRVSRTHAKIYRNGENFYLADLKSRNTTVINGTKIVPGKDHRLRAGDTINIGNCVFLYFGAASSAARKNSVTRETLDDMNSWTGAEGMVPQIVERADMESSDSHLSGLMVDHRSAQVTDSDPSGLGSGAFVTEDLGLGKFTSCEGTPATYSLLEECGLIRSLLDTNHVKCDHAERHGLLERTLKRDALVKNVLGFGFYRFVVMDAERGLNPAGVLDDGQFLEGIRADIVQAFGLRLDRSAFHIEDIFQMLKDEHRSLFCFANFQLVPLAHFRTIRGFTQGVHRVLLLTQGTRDIAREEGLQDGSAE
jgi:hypothetical protein